MVKRRGGTSALALDFNRGNGRNMGCAGTVQLHAFSLRDEILRTMTAGELGPL
jgi:hypothetical protein